ncbi:MAG TPA: stage II sporulation protein M [Nitrosopumilaceae archaeon]|nr:stage II sporulation protein M [Nitrosopumilaceae archaeon]
MTVKTRALAFGVFAGVFLLSYTIGTGYKMSSEEAGKFLKDFQSATEGIDAVGIFFHNSSVALPMFVPAFGVAWGSFTGWQTGAAFNAVIGANPALSSLPPLALLLASPFGILELVAYSIGMSRSFLLVLRIVKKNPIKKEIIPLAAEIGIVIAILLIGGFIESSTISQHVSLSS